MSNVPPLLPDHAVAADPATFDTAAAPHGVTPVAPAVTAKTDPCDRMVAVRDLVGTHAIADRLGLSAPQVVTTWRRRHTDFPTPVAQIGGAMIWAWPDIEAWARATGRLGR